MFLGLGSNLGNRRAHLSAALGRIAELATIRRVSSVYETDPVGFVGQPLFWNLVSQVSWSGSAPALLGRLKAIERELGRRKTFRGGPRVIDCDILDFGGQVSRSRRLVLPHPRLPERRFVLAPLAEIAPRWRHPGSGLTAHQMMATLPKKPGARRLARETRSFASLRMDSRATTRLSTSGGRRGRPPGASAPRRSASAKGNPRPRSRRGGSPRPSLRRSRTRAPRPGRPD